LSDAILEARKQKPVVAIIDDGIAASAAMWIASAASEIYLTKKTDQVGSIGVYTTLADWYSYYANRDCRCVTFMHHSQQTKTVITVKH
jgi:protease-4